MSTDADRHQNTGGGTTAVSFRGSDADVTHSKEHALESEPFERLYLATQRLDQDYFSLECRFVLMVAGRLGLRAGEIAHMTEEWVDPERRMIDIPRFEPCIKGKDGGICGHCRQSAKQMVEYNDDLTLEAAEELVWGPKTRAGARSVPYDVSPRTKLAVEDYFARFDEFQASQSAIGRRVDRVAEEAAGIEPDDIWPHALRATAASYWASHPRVNAVNLKALLGWKHFDEARAYIGDSAKRTATVLRGAQ